MPNNLSFQNFKVQEFSAVFRDHDSSPMNMLRKNLLATSTSVIMEEAIDSHWDHV